MHPPVKVAIVSMCAIAMSAVGCLKLRDSLECNIGFSKIVFKISKFKFSKSYIYLGKRTFPFLTMVKSYSETNSFVTIF